MKAGECREDDVRAGSHQVIQLFSVVQVARDKSHPLHGEAVVGGGGGGGGGGVVAKQERKRERERERERGC